MKYLWVLVALFATTSYVWSAESVRTTENFNDDWTFQLVKKQGIRKTWLNMKKPGEALESEEMENAIPVRLPHDWAISGPFDMTISMGDEGRLPWRGVGLYTKKFSLPTTDSTKTILLDFDGCMAFPEVYVNGKYVGGWDYGYLGFRVNITPYIKFGSENVVQVRCDTRVHGSRWYPGAGIYRNVHLIKSQGKNLLSPGSVFVSTVEMNKEKARLRFDLMPERVDDQPLSAHIVMTDPQGKIVGTGEVSIPEKSKRYEMNIPQPLLWDVDHPFLYKITVTLYAANKASDELSFPFGIRTMKYTADDGFYLNGKRLQLYGVDLHHDQGILGAASHPVAIERQLRIMKDMGVNAIRTSHNPNSSAFMDACDRLGFVVWNELFDKWNDTSDLLDQKQFDEYTDRQVRQFVHRDWNRPSVSMWSIGNEIFDIENNEVGNSNPFNDAARRVKHVVDCYKKYDKTRQIGLGCCVSKTCANGVRDAVDMLGWNYNQQYNVARKVYKDKPMVYSESASAVSTRGYYELPHPNGKAVYNKQTHQVDGYDLSSVPWGDIADVEFERMERDRFCAGEFVWTGFDYWGEPSPFNKEARSSYFGIVDLCGIPKDRFFLYRSFWNPKETTVHILPHWNWTNSGQRKVPIYVYTNGDSAELFLNGKSLGKRSKNEKYQKQISRVTDSKTVVTVSSEEKLGNNNEFNKGSNVLLSDRNKRWCAASADPNQWLTVDLGEVKAVRAWQIVFERSIDQYQYVMLASNDGSAWREISAKKDFSGTGDQTTLNFGDKPVSARYFKIEFKGIKQGSWASIRQFVLSDGELDEWSLPNYYQSIDRYRLRWEGVEYQPGTVEAVAYKDGKIIGRSTVKTASDPVAIRLTPEKKAFAHSDDLVYVLVETVDKDGTPCPLDTRNIQAKVSGPAELVGIGNGNSMGYDIVTDAEHALFYGKAMIVLRSTKQSGSVQLSVSAKDVRTMTIEIPKK